MASFQLIDDGKYLKGVREISHGINEMLAQHEQLTLNGMENIAVDILSRAQQKAPKATGALRNAANIDTPVIKGNEVISAVRFTGKYAVNQHEHVEYQHASGEAKYLEKAVLEKPEQLKAMMAEQLQSLFGG